MPARRRYHVYVVELSKRVWEDSKRYRDANPQYNPVLQCLYVGMTGQTPKVRFEKHKKGHRTKSGIKISNHYVEKYGLYLRPSLYKHLNPLSKSEAILMEEKLVKRDSFYLLNHFS